MRFARCACAVFGESVACGVVGVGDGVGGVVRPGSRLWKVPLNTSSVRQRVTLGVLLTVPGLVTVAAVAWQLVSAVR